MSALPFAGRETAGDALAEPVVALGLSEPLVLGIPRGGVVVADLVATALGADLDVMIVRKIGAPGNPELGLGAVGATGDPVLDGGVVARLGIDGDHVRHEVETQRREAVRREMAYRSGRVPALVTGRDLVLVDDGIATGGTVAAAATLLRSLAPRRLALAVPVAPPASLDRLGGLFDTVVCLHTPEPYVAVGRWYRDFRQVTDEQVRGLLSRRER